MINYRRNVYTTVIKRCFDIVVAGLLLLITSPIFFIIYLALLLQNNGSAFFFQRRPGLNEMPFTIIKFKTMNERRDEVGNLLPDNQRLTLLGSFIRKFSLDELPQLINVLMGDMSLVGPRPLLFRYVELYNSEQRRRHDVRPGITGWAQVNGRNSIPWYRKFQYDVYYVDHVSFSLDLKIIFRTIVKVVKREGVNQSADRPMDPFNGNN